MAYTTEDGVYSRTGFNSSSIQVVTEKSEAEVTILVDGFISDAQEDIRSEIGYPIVINEERHYGDGNKNIFDLGPEDDAFAEEGNYDPENNVIEVYNAWFGSFKKKKPYPENCELGTEDLASSWSGNSTITEDTTHQVHGSNCIKVVFDSSNQYAQYPDGSTTVYLDKIVDTWSDLFFYVKATNASATFTIRLYDKDGNYAEETFTLRQANVGQYIWLDLDSFDTVLDWDDVRVQYIRIYSDTACTIYLDNVCFSDSWAFSAPSGKFHVSVADNISSERSPSGGFPFFVTYSYDPFLASVPRNIKGAAECLAGVYLITHLRGTKYQELDFEVWNETMEADTPFQRGGMLGIKTSLEKEYARLMRKWSGGSYGVI